MAERCCGGSGLAGIGSVAPSSERKSPSSRESTPATELRRSIAKSDTKYARNTLAHMDLLWEELTAGMPDRRQFMHVLIRLTAATVLGAAVGFQREKAGKPAGLRTHMLVCVGTAVFVVACLGAGMSSEGLSRVIQGLVTGIGFIGAGTILKLSEERDIQGLTTAAGVWMTAAIGIAAGLGCLGIALLSTLFSLIILVFALPVENLMRKGGSKKGVKM